VKAAAEPARISSHHDLVVLAALLAGAAYLRFHLLAHKSFWFDEGFSVGIARLDWSNFLHLLWLREANMALYYVLLKLWLIFGISEFYVRTLSVVFGLAAIPVVYALGVRLFGARTGLIAAGLLSINAFHARYSQEARGYTLLVFLSALSSWLWVQCIDHPTPRNWRFYTLASVLTVYAHFYGILVVLGHWLSLMLLPRENRPGGAPLRHLRFFAYGMLPIAIFLGRAGTQPMNWLPRPNGPILRHFFQSLAGNGGPALLGLYILAWIAAAYARERPDRLQRWRYDLLFFWLAFPIAAVVAASQFKSIFLARYLIVCLPASVLLAAAGIARLRTAVQPGLLVAIGALSLAGVFGYYQRDFDVGRDNWRAATQFVLANAQPGDGIFFYTAPGRMPFEYYRTLFGHSARDPEVLYPSSGEQITYRDFLVAPLAEVLQNPPPDRKRVWLFLNEHRPGGHMDMASEVLCAWYGKRYKLLEKHSMDEMDILLYGSVP
jgi:mannosyltransferase